MTEDASDRDLVCAALRGDQRAAEQLLRRHWPALQATARARRNRIGVSRETATDSLQDFAAKLCEHQYRVLALWHGLTEPANGSIGPYLRTVLINTMNDVGRRSRRRREHELPVESEELAGFVDDGSPAIDKNIPARLRAEIERCLAAALDDRQRQLLQRWYADHSHAEIAAQLDLTEGHSRVLLKRTLEALRHCLERRNAIGPEDV